MKVLVIGSGGREHALAHTFSRQGHRVYCLPGNAGTASFCEPLKKKIDPQDLEALAAYAEEEGIALTAVGPEAYLERGIADLFEARGLPLFGPLKEAAKLESSKAFSKKFMTDNGIPTARFAACSSSVEAKKAVEENFPLWGGAVIKPSGLTAGKGVIPCRTLQEAMAAIEEIMDKRVYGEAGAEVVIEELLVGKEVSLMAFGDGKKFVPMIPAQDHKRLYDGGQGPNTGGVGAYTPTPFLDEEMTERLQKGILDRTAEGLLQEKIVYRGVLYVGVMLTKSGPKVLEYNCRFGDPEAQTILPLLEGDLAGIMLGCCRGELDPSLVKWKSGASCCVVMVSRGYPKSYKSGYPIAGLEEAEKEGALVFHAGTALNGSGGAVTSGGRVLGVTALAGSLEEAIVRAYGAAEKISFNGAFYRKDIGSQARSAIPETALAS